MTTSEPRLATVHGHHVYDMASESNHRIANHLDFLVSVVRLQRKAVAKGPAQIPAAEVGGILDGVAGMIINVAHLHRTLACQRPDTLVDLAQYLSANCSTFLSSLTLSSRTRIREQLDSGCFVSAEQAQLISLLATEVLMNAIKYAHPTGIRVEISLVCRRVDGNKLVVEIADDGIGLPENFDPAKDGGLGFTLIRSLTDSAGAAMRVDSSSLGTKFTFEFDVVECEATEGKQGNTRHNGESPPGPVGKFG